MYTCKGVYFVCNKDYYVYRDLEDMSDYPATKLLREVNEDETNSWTYDEEGTMIEQDDILDFLTIEFCNRFPDLKEVREINCTLKSYDGWLIAKNESFCIGVRETENGLLIELLQIQDNQEQDCKEYYLAINSILSQRIYN